MRALNVCFDKVRQLADCDQVSSQFENAMKNSTLPSLLTIPFANLLTENLVLEFTTVHHTLTSCKKLEASFQLTR